MTDKLHFTDKLRYITRDSLKSEYGNEKDSLIAFQERRDHLKNKNKGFWILSIVFLLFALVAIGWVICAIIFIYLDFLGYFAFHNPWLGAVFIGTSLIQVLGFILAFGKLFKSIID